MIDVNFRSCEVYMLVLASAKDIEEASIGHPTPEAKLMESRLDIPGGQVWLPTKIVFYN